jgi:uncharacterized protein YbjT (DUF2867 family)
MSDPFARDWTFLTAGLEGAVATVRLNRPDARNALNTGLMLELTEFARAIRRRTDIAAVILTGSERYFSAGADLAAQGERVVEVTSRPPRTANQVQADRVTGAGLRAAFDGADRAFLLSPPGHVNQDELLGPVIDEARARGLKKVVLMSAMGANADEAAPLRKAEKQLEASGLPYNIIRPNWFMQNFNTFWLQGIVEQATVALPVGTAKGSFIDARDIAAVARKLLTSDTFANRDFDLTGPTALVLGVISSRSITGRPSNRMSAKGTISAYAESARRGCCSSLPTLAASARPWCAGSNSQRTSTSSSAPSRDTSI